MDKPTPTDRTRAPGPRAFTPPRAGINRGAVIAAAVLIALALAGGYYWWQQSHPVSVPLPPPPVQQAPVAATPAPAVQAPAPTPTAEPLHPIEQAPVAAEAPPPLTLDKADPVITRALTELLNAKTVASMLRTDDFVRRTVATVDGLGRGHAAPRLWPVNTTPGRFTVLREGDQEIIAPANAARYATFVAFADSINLAGAAALYKSQYPLFQAAYRELGYPSGHFNDRLVEVIDLMLATPEPSGPLALRLTEVKGEIASTQPWLRYEFADPKLEALPAGQKLLLRIGNENAQRLKARLRAFRSAITARPPTMSAGAVPAKN
jgi:hypothetical protein